MKNLVIPILLAMLLSSCDDGDVIVQEFDFDDVALENCAVADTQNTYTFYKRNNDSFESIVLTFSTPTEFINTVASIDDIAIGGNNFFEYRRFTGMIGTDYYCSDVPPSAPSIVQAAGGIAGTIQINTVLDEEFDDDGISAIEEGIVLNDDGSANDAASRDTDMDGIPDYRDMDDDGDNIPTSLEGVVVSGGVVDIAASRDTDMDGIPDYLEKDDDGDGIDTLQEDLDGDLNPVNDRDNVTGLPHYRDVNFTISASPAITEYIEHTYSRGFETTIQINNLVIDLGDDNTLVQNPFTVGTTNTTPVQITLTPTL